MNAPPEKKDLSVEALREGLQSTLSKRVGMLDSDRSRFFDMDRQRIDGLYGRHIDLNELITDAELREDLHGKSFANDSELRSFIDSLFDLGTECGEQVKAAVIDGICTRAKYQITKRDHFEDPRHTEEAFSDFKKLCDEADKMGPCLSQMASISFKPGTSIDTVKTIVGQITTLRGTVGKLFDEFRKKFNPSRGKETLGITAWIDSRFYTPVSILEHSVEGITFSLDRELSTERILTIRRNTTERSNVIIEHSKSWQWIHWPFAAERSQLDYLLRQWLMYYNFNRKHSGLEMYRLMPVQKLAYALISNSFNRQKCDWISATLHKLTNNTFVLQ